MRKLKLEELGRVSAEEFKSTEKNPVVVVLDNIRSMNNVGSAFRTCDAFAAEQLFLCGVTAKPPHREINKTAIGAQDTVDWKYFDKTVDAVQELKNQGYKIYGVEQTDKSVLLNQMSYPENEKVAFVFGNEVFGVSDEVLPLLDACIEIPQFGTKHSLNISVTVGILLWDFVSKL